MGGRPPQSTRQMTKATKQANELTPEMEQRIAEIIANAQANSPAEVPAEPEPEIDVDEYRRSLMRHVIALRQELAEMRDELHAVSQVTDAVGQAVGQMYVQFKGGAK